MLPRADDAESRLSEAIEGYLNARERGESIAPEEWVRRFPDIADELRECLAALKFLEDASARESRAPGRESGEAVAGLAAPGLSANAFRARGYAVLEEIGRGGMGIVYRALQLKTKRLVALKFLHGDIHSSPFARRRFEREVELAASLDHPGIVRILESGQVDGRDYYAMEYVDGVPLHRWCAKDAEEAAPSRARDPSGYDLHARLRLFVAICDAVNYAHQRGVIHRDLKPANIVVDRQGWPRILDFGLARTIDASIETSDHATRTGQLVGTLPYLCPEQASGAGDRVDVRGDVYTLGVILFEMLTGRLPYDTTSSLDETLHNIVHEPPPRPSHFHNLPKGDMDAIVLKALEKAREDRYQSAALFAEDVRCYLRHEPVDANRTSRFYLIRKAYARHRTGVHVAAAAGTFILIASAVITSLYFQVRRERGLLADQLHISTLNRGAAYLASGHDFLARDLLTNAYRERPDVRAYWSLLCYYIQNPQAGRMIRTGWVTHTAVSPDRSIAAIGNLSGEVLLYRMDSAEQVQRLKAHEGAVRGIAFARDGDILASAGENGDIAFWRAADWGETRREHAHPGGAKCLRRAAMVDRLVSLGRDGRVLLWDSDPQSVYRSRPLADLPQGITACDISPSGEMIALAAPSSNLTIVNLKETNPPRRIGRFGQPVEAVSFDPSGRSVAAWSGGQVSLWNIDNGQLEWTADAGLAEPRPTTLWDFDAAARPAYLAAHTCWSPCPRFSDDGSLLACGNWGAALRVWRAADGHPLAELRSHGTAIYSVAFEPGTHRALTGCIGEQMLWDIDRHPGLSGWEVDKGTTRTCVAASGDGRIVIWGGAPDGSISIASMDTSAPLERIRIAASPVEAVALDSAGRLLAASDGDGNVSLCSIEGSPQAHKWQTGTRTIWALGFSPDGTRLAAAGQDGRVTVWNCADRSVAASWQAHSGLILSLAFAPDSRHLATGGRDWLTRYWEVGNDKPLGEWRHSEWVNAVTFAVAGLRLAAGGAELQIRIGSPVLPPEILTWHAHAHWINALAFVDAGRVLVSGGNDESLRFWDAQTGDNLGSLPSIGGAVHSLAASKDGRKLVVGAARRVQVIDFAAAAELLDRQERSSQR